MLRNQGEVCRATAGLPVSSSYFAFSQVSRYPSAKTTTARTRITEKMAVMLTLFRFPWTFEPTQTANNGAPVQRLTEQSAEAVTRPIFFSAIAGAYVTYGGAALRRCRLLRTDYAW